MAVGKAGGCTEPECVLYMMGGVSRKKEGQRNRRERRLKGKKTRWKKGLDLYSTIEELIADASARAEEEASQREEGQI